MELAKQRVADLEAALATIQRELNDARIAADKAERAWRRPIPADEIATILAADDRQKELAEQIKKKLREIHDADHGGKRKLIAELNALEEDYASAQSFSLSGYEEYLDWMEIRGRMGCKSFEESRRGNLESDIQHPELFDVWEWRGDVLNAIKHTTEYTTEGGKYVLTHTFLYSKRPGLSVYTDAWLK